MANHENLDPRSPAVEPSVHKGDAFETFTPEQRILERGSTSEKAYQIASALAGGHPSADALRRVEEYLMDEDH